jgi:hypothetical protein
MAAGPGTSKANRAAWPVGEYDSVCTFAKIWIGAGSAGFGHTGLACDPTSSPVTAVDDKRAR